MMMLESMTGEGGGARAARRAAPYRLSREDAIQLWIARWLRIRRKDIRARYPVDPRRIYEVWQEITFRGSREEAEARFRRDYPGLVAQTDFSPHKCIPRPKRPPREAQGDLFEGFAEA